MLKLLNKMFGKKEVTVEIIKETFTIAEMKEVIECWDNAIESKRPITKIYIVNSKMSGSHRRGQLLNVEYYEGQYIKGYKEVTVGGVFTVPTSIEDLQDSNILYVPHFS